METLTSTLLGLARSRRSAASANDLMSSLAQSERERHRAAHDRFQAEARRRTDATTEAVLRSVGHDLRSPLAAIMLAASTLRRPDLELEPNEREELAATIAAEAVRLDWLLSHPRELLGSERGGVR